MKKKHLICIKHNVGCKRGCGQNIQGDKGVQQRIQFNFIFFNNFEIQSDDNDRQMSCKVLKKSEVRIIVTLHVRRQYRLQSTGKSEIINNVEKLNILGYQHDQAQENGKTGAAP